MDVDAPTRRKLTVRDRAVVHIGDPVAENGDYSRWCRHGHGLPSKRITFSNEGVILRLQEGSTECVGLSPLSANSRRNRQL